MGECWGEGTATFMILGNICTRSCGFCGVKTGRPSSVDWAEPEKVARSIKLMEIKHAVITSVDRDDLKDSGAGHFAECIHQMRVHNPDTTIEVLVPDFRGRMEIALETLTNEPPDVFNHNLETVPRLYRKARPGADYEWSLNLLKRYKAANPNVRTKSGLMLGLGEEIEEVKAELRDMREHDIDMLTLGQYLQPSRDHLKVERFVHPDEFAMLKQYAEEIGFAQVASGPLVRSSYHADLQAKGIPVE